MRYGLISIDIQITENVFDIAGFGKGGPRDLREQYEYFGELKFINSLISIVIILLVELLKELAGTQIDQHVCLVLARFMSLLLFFPLHISLIMV